MTSVNATSTAEVYLLRYNRFLVPISGFISPLFILITDSDAGLVASTGIFHHPNPILTLTLTLTLLLILTVTRGWWTIHPVYPHHANHQHHHLRRPAGAKYALSDQYPSGCHSNEWRADGSVVTAGVRLSVLAGCVPRLAAAFLVLRLLLSDRAPADCFSYNLGMADVGSRDSALQLRLSSDIREKTMYDSISGTTDRSHPRRRDLLASLSFRREHVHSRRGCQQNES